MIWHMIVLFILGGLQGGIGWIMVKSGLNEEDLYVSHIRLAIHFIAALGLLWYVLWFALKLSISPAQRAEAPGSAASPAGYWGSSLSSWCTAPSWPAFTQHWPPALAIHQRLRRSRGFFSQGGFWADVTHNPITIHFIHRGLAYVLVILIAMWYIRSWKIPSCRAPAPLHYSPCCCRYSSACSP